MGNSRADCNVCTNEKMYFGNPKSGGDLTSYGFLYSLFSMRGGAGENWPQLSSAMITRVMRGAGRLA